MSRPRRKGRPRNPHQERHRAERTAARLGPEAWGYELRTDPPTPRTAVEPAAESDDRPHLELGTNEGAAPQ